MGRLTLLVLVLGQQLLCHHRKGTWACRKALPSPAALGTSLPLPCPVLISLCVPGDARIHVDEVEGVGDVEAPAGEETG